MNKGYVWMNNGQEQRLVPPNDVSSCISSGWIRGKLTKDGIPTKIPCKLCGKLISKFDGSSGLCRSCYIESGSAKQYWSTPERRKMQSERAKRPRHEGFRQDQSQRMVKMYENHPDQRILRSIAMKRSWKEGKIQPTSKFHTNHSKAELLMVEALKQIYGEDCVCTNSISLSGNRWCMPDAIIYNTVVVEYFGDYWHANPDIYEAEDIVDFNNDRADVIWARDADREDQIRTYGSLIFPEHPEWDVRVSDVVIIWENETKHLCSLADWVDYLKGLPQLVGIEEFISI